MQDYVVLIFLEVSCSPKMIFSPIFNVLDLIYMIIYSANIFISFFFFKGTKSNDPVHIDYVLSGFTFISPKTKKHTSSSTERYERQKKM